jgi:hypothetical protein
MQVVQELWGATPMPQAAGEVPVVEEVVILEGPVARVVLVINLVSQELLYITQVEVEVEALVQ